MEEGESGVMAGEMAALQRAEEAMGEADEGGNRREVTDKGKKGGIVAQFVAEAMERLQVALTLDDVVVVALEGAENEWVVNIHNGGSGFAELLAKVNVFIAAASEPLVETTMGEAGS